MKKKVVSVLLCLAMTGALMSGCAAKGEAADKSGGSKDKIKIGSVIMNTSGEWFAEVIQGMQDAAKHYKADISIVSSDNEVSKESDNVSTFVAQQVDALVISPLSTDASIAAVESAKSANIPVVNWNTTVNTKTNGFVGVSNQKLGGMTGDYVKDYVEKNYPDGCKMALITNSNYEVGVERCKGFEDAIKGTKGLDVVAKQDAESQEEGLDITEQILTAHPDVDVIWAWNQTSLVGCVAALQNAKNTKTVVMGTDMSVDLAKDMLSDSVKLQAITTQMPHDIGYTAVENAVKAVKGKKVKKETLVPLKTYVKDNKDEVQKYIDDHKDLVKK